MSWVKFLCDLNNVLTHKTQNSPHANFLKVSANCHGWELGL